MNLAYLEYRLSGGASNSDPAASLGGAMSSAKVTGFTVTGISNVTGVTALDAPGCVAGADGVLDFTASGTLLTWQGPGASAAGDPVDVGTNGRYVLTDADGGQLLVSVTAASLPGTDATDSAVTVTAVTNGLFDDVTEVESLEGDEEYRCFYVTNTHSTDTFLSVKASIYQQTDGDDSIQLGLDPAGIDGTATTIAGEGTAPTGVTFSDAGTGVAELLIGDLGPGQSQAIWQKRSVPEANTAALNNNTSILRVSAYYV